MPEDVGVPEQRNRPWPLDPTTRCMTTYASNCVHVSEDCRWYRAMVTNARNRGAKVHLVEWLTTGEGRARGKGICGCWDASGVPRG